MGAELTYAVTKDFNLRGTIRGLDYSDSFTESNIKYDGTLKMRNGGITGDWFPFGNGFRMSAGAMYNGNELYGTGASPNQEYDVGGTIYRIDGNLNANIDWRKFAPYLGLGWGNPVAKDSNWSFSFDLGVMFTGSPTATFDATGTYTNVNNPSDTGSIDLNDPTNPFTQDVNSEIAKLNDDISDYKFYPVVQFGVHYKF